MWLTIRPDSVDDCPPIVTIHLYRLTVSRANPSRYLTGGVLTIFRQTTSVRGFIIDFRLRGYWAVGCSDDISGCCRIIEYIRCRIIKVGIVCKCIV